MKYILMMNAPKAGFEIAYQAFYPVGTLDHSASLTSLKAAKPDWIFVTGYTTGEVPSNGVAVFDLRTSAGSFPPDTYFFTIRAGNAVKTVTFRVTG